MEPGIGTESGTGRRPAPVPADGTQDGTAVLAPASTPVPMSAAARAGTALRYRYRGAASSAREFELSAERFLYAFAHPQPETMQEHRAYVKSRAWVPEGMPEGAERAAIVAGILHHVVIGRPLKALAKSLKFAAMKADEAGDRAFRFYGWLAFIGLLVLILFLAHIF